MALLDSPYSDSTADHLELPHSVSSRMNTVSFEQSALARWVSSENTDLRTLRVMLRDQMDPVEVLVLIARSIQECTETQWNSFPAVNADNNQGKTTKADVYAQLLQQIATQQPRVFLHMHHLMPILADAIGSHSKTWRERCLWVCLKAVMHAPIGIATYGFLYINTIAAVEAVQSITSCLQYTDSRFKLVTAFANDAQLNIDASIHFNLDLKITAMDIGTVQLNPFLIPEIWSPSIIRSSLQTCGKSTCILLTWIAFAIRPLAVEDLDLILALDEGEPNRGTETIGIQHAPAAYLQKSIPEFTEISRGRIFPRVPYPDTRWVLSRLSPEHHGTAASPHFYLAQSCFSFLVTHIFKFCRVKEVDDSGVASYEIEGKSNATQNIKLEQHQQGSHKVVIDEIPAHLRGLAKYAAQNWITHYRLAMTSHQSAEHEQEALEPLLSFVKDRAYVCQWLYLVEHFSFPLYQSEGFDSIDLELVQSYLGMDTMKNLETLYQLASRSLPLSWLGRLLVHAAELGDKTIVDSLCSSLGAIEPEAISRALAATDRDIHEALRASAMSILKDEYWKTMAQAHLTAQVLGNVATSNNLLDELLNKTTWSGKEGWFSNTLDRAAEYGDERLLEKLGGTQDMKKYIASQGEELRWTPFHRVAYYGNLQCLYSLWNAGFSSSCFNILTPDGRSPLFISSSRGFGSITRFLALSDAPLNSRNGQYQQTALHAAGFYGHWKTTMTLLDEGADFTAVDSKGNFSLHLTLHQGHSHVAALTISRFDSPLHGRPLSLLNKANLEGMTVLFYAAERDLPALAKALLERGVNPDTMDYHARTPLYYAAKSGRADFIKELISHGAKTNQTFQLLRSIPLHDACYRGHADAIEALTVNVSDLLLEDSWGRTPLAAACAGGHLQAVKALVGHYDMVQLAKGLKEAAQHGHCKIVSYLLDWGCPINESGTDGESALCLAVSEGHPRMVELLILRGADIEHQNPSGDSAIFLSIESGIFEVTKLLVDRGTQLNIERLDGVSPLTWAMYWKQPSLVRLLLERGSRMRLSSRWDHYTSLLDFSWDISVPAVAEVLLCFYARGNHEDGLTSAEALITAMKRGSSKLLDLVLNTWFASNTIKHASIGNALHYAASKGDTKLLKQLLDHPAGKSAINQVEPGDGTPLHAAISAGTDAEILYLLLANGADTGIVAGRYGSVLNAACFSAKLENIKICTRNLPKIPVELASGRYGTPAQSAVVGYRSEPPERCIKALQALKDMGIASSAVGGQYSTALHAAVYLEVHKDVVAWLIQWSIHSLVIRDIAGRFPLHLAIMSGSWSQAEIIWEKTKWTYQQLYGSPLKLPKDNQGLTVLHYAAISKSTDRVTETLARCDAGGFDTSALINKPDHAGWTPLHWACRWPRKVVIQTLINVGANPQARTKNGWTPRQIALLHTTADSGDIEPLPVSNTNGAKLPVGQGVLYNGCCVVCYLVSRP